MDLSLLETLKDKLVHATEFSEVWTYFLDNFGENPEFHDLGERARDAFLEAVLAQVVGKLTGETPTLAHVLFTRLPEQGFIHGAYNTSNLVASVLYFEDIRMGMVAVISTASTMTHFARFSGRPLTPAPTPSEN